MPCRYRRLRCALAILSAVPFVAIASLWLLTRSTCHLVSTADDAGNALVAYAHAERVLVIRATGWPEARPLTRESRRAHASSRVTFTPRTATRVMPGVVFAEGRAELRTPAGAAEPLGYLVPGTTWMSFYSATAGESWLLECAYPPLLILAALPLWWVPAWAWQRDRARRRRLAGLCVACGYDARANPGLRCPECGAPSGATGPAPTS